MTRRRFSSSPSLVLLLLLSPAALVASQCDGGANDSDVNSDADRATALYYKLGAIASILAAGAIGVLLPVVGQKKFPALHPDKSVFFVVKAFAAGVILSTGFIHVLPDAFESLTSPCLPEKPWGSFPFAGFIAMAAAMGTLALDSFATSFFSRAAAHGDNKSSDPEAAAAGDDGGGQMAVHTHATHGHSHGAISAAGGGASQQLVRHRVISQVLEVGIVVHSVIIGISLGASQSPATVRPLLAALTFHQFFEGMGLGGCIAQAKFRPRVVTMMTLFFSLTTPLGIAIGIGASSAYEDNSATALVLEGAFNAASAGILIYMALVDLLAADFMNPKVQASGRLQVGVQVALLLGAGFMSLLAIWA